MSILVIAEHDNSELNPATLSAVTAAGQMGGDVTVLVIGNGSGAVADAAVKVAGVSKVLHADDAGYAHATAENRAALIVSLAGDYSHIVSPATTSGKNVMPRVSALLDSQQVSEITEVHSADTFVRPIYAGNAMATVQSTDDKKVITVRPTGFEKAAEEGGSASVESVAAVADPGLSSFVDERLSESDRPELATAKITQNRCSGTIRPSRCSSTGSAQLVTT